MKLRYWVGSGVARIIDNVERVVYMSEGMMEVTYIVCEGFKRIKLEEFENYTRFTITLE